MNGLSPTHGPTAGASFRYRLPSHHADQQLAGTLGENALDEIVGSLSDATKQSIEGQGLALKYLVSSQKRMSRRDREEDGRHHRCQDNFERETLRGQRRIRQALSSHQPIEHIKAIVEGESMAIGHIKKSAELQRSVAWEKRQDAEKRHADRLNDFATICEQGLAQVKCLGDTVADVTQSYCDRIAVHTSALNQFHSALLAAQAQVREHELNMQSLACDTELEQRRITLSEAGQRLSLLTARQELEQAVMHGEQIAAQHRKDTLTAGDIQWQAQRSEEDQQLREFALRRDAQEFSQMMKVMTTVLVAAETFSGAGPSSS